jgi:hypothetical protein
MLNRTETELPENDDQPFSNAAKKLAAKDRASYELQEHLNHSPEEAQAVVNHPPYTLTDMENIERIAGPLKSDLVPTIDSFYADGPQPIKPDNCTQITNRMVDRFPIEPVVYIVRGSEYRVLESAVNISRGLVRSLLRASNFRKICEEERIEAEKIYETDFHYMAVSEAVERVIRKYQRLFYKLDQGISSTNNTLLKSQFILNRNRLLSLIDDEAEKYKHSSRNPIMLTESPIIRDVVKQIENNLSARQSTSMSAYLNFMTTPQIALAFVLLASFTASFTLFTFFRPVNCVSKFLVSSFGIFKNCFKPSRQTRDEENQRTFGIILQ